MRCRLGQSGRTEITMIKCCAYLWQLPQNLLGLLLRLVYKGEDTIYEDAVVRRSSRMGGGISLGKYIIIEEDADNTTIMHEYGHCRQSKMLGWFYLIIVGLPSLIWAGICRYTRRSYYWFYTEKWADRLAGIER